MFEDLKNNIDFFIRNKTQFSRKNFIEKDLKKIEYNNLENLYIEDILSQCFTIRENQESLRILDIGAKNWFYAKGEYKFFNQISKNIIMDGVELDAYRLYSNFYSRYEVAKYYIKDLNGVNYIIGNLLDIQNKYDYITWFLPFVAKEPHIFWGLPKKYFYPEKLVLHAYTLLKDNGKMLIINQGENEAEIQKNLLEKLKIPYLELGKIESEYLKYKYNRFGFLVRSNN
ncbi:hypothetical protein IKB17_03090 [bacterium]|nr:hypothetical protein [bacterium]